MPSGVEVGPASADLKLSGSVPRYDNVTQAALRKRRERLREALGLEVYEVELLPDSRNRSATRSVGAGSEDNRRQSTQRNHRRAPWH